MIPNFAIRQAAANDAEALLGLYMHLSPNDARCPIDLAQQNITRLQQLEGSAILIGEADREILTTCTLVVIPNLTRSGAPYAIIENVVTHPSRRGQGLGTAILDAATARAWQYGCYKVMLSTGSTSPATLSFYESAGFEQSRTGFQKRRLPKRTDT